MFKLVEESAGAGELSRHGAVPHPVVYRIRRFQGTMGEGGLPVPGLYRVEGELSFENAGTPPEVSGTLLTLRLEDGRSMDVTVMADGRFLAEGRHPRGCSCC
jgi:hypothetical protein